MLDQLTVLAIEIMHISPKMVLQLPLKHKREFDHRRLRVVVGRATALKQGFSLGRAQPAPTKNRSSNLRILSHQANQPLQIESFWERQ
jgi:hypothetical protein